MKSLIPAIAFFVIMTFTGSIVGEVEIKQEPLTWEQAALTDGAELYQELCAACHGLEGKGDGPAAGAMAKPVSDLTVLAANNDGVFPEKEVVNSIAGESRVISHGTIDMPVWGQQFEDLRPDWKSVRRHALARQRIRNLTLHVEDLQIK